MAQFNNNKKRALSALRIFVLASIATACASQPPQPEPAVIPEPVCEPEVVVQEKEVIVDRLPGETKRKLTTAMEAHRGDYFELSRESYESVLADGAGLQSDAFALWGMVTLFLDRDYSEYSRDNAKTVLSVMEHKLTKASEVPENDIRATEEARLLLTAMKVLFAADIAKDDVVAENKKLRSELANRDQAISRLRELTVGKE